MNSKHLIKGDECPPLVTGKLRIYNMRFCPYAQRALLVAAAKKIPYDVVNINLMEKPEFIFEKNPGGKVPAIDTPFGPLYESLVVSDYLDESFPEPGSGGDTSTAANSGKLHSTDPYQKALDRIMVENFSKIACLDHRTFFPGWELDKEGVNRLETEINETLITFEKELGRRGTKFFGGNEKPGMLDLMIWPWFERLPTHELLYKDKFDFESAKQNLKRLNAWEAEMKSDPAVLESFLPPEVHMEYRDTRRQGVTNYDILVGK